MALSADQFANVSLSPALNVLMVKKYSECHLFGDEDDTMSYVIGMNNKKQTHSRFARFWEKVLNFIEPGHLDKAITAKDKRDFEAVKRLQNKGLL